MAEDRGVLGGSGGGGGDPGDSPSDSGSETQEFELGEFWSQLGGSGYSTGEVKSLLRNPAQYIIATVGGFIITTFILRPAYYAAGLLDWIGRQVADYVVVAQSAIATAAHPVQRALLLVPETINATVRQQMMAFGLGAPLAAAVVVVVQAALIMALLAFLVVTLPPLVTAVLEAIPVIGGPASESVQAIGSGAAAAVRELRERLT
jgi:hypothetical protein